MGKGIFTHSPKQSLKQDDIGAVTHAYGDIGVDGKTSVTAIVKMQKMSEKKANISISYRIVSNSGTDSSDASFISIAKLKTLLGLTGLIFSAWTTDVAIHETRSLSGTTLTEISPLYNTAYCGNSGYHAGTNGTTIFLGREYNGSPAFGGWGLTAPCYKAGLYGIINIWGADIA